MVCSNASMERILNVKILLKCINDYLCGMIVGNFMVLVPQAFAC